MRSQLQQLMETMMLHSRPRALRNYILPGLTSYKLADLEGGGMLRVFEMERDQETEVVPHNHRYAFGCYVVHGSVEHTIYGVSGCDRSTATHAAMQYNHVGKCIDSESARFVQATFTTRSHGPGDYYALGPTTFHRVRFSRGTVVLFVEGPPDQQYSEVLVPYERGRICSSFVWGDWMMQPKEGER